MQRLREEENRIKYSNQFQNSQSTQNVANYQTVNSNINNINKEYQQVQQDIQNELRRKAQEDYTKAYHNYLRGLGFKIRYKKTFKDYLAIFLTILVLIIIGFILWKVPYTHNKILEIYYTNPVINFIVGFIIEIFKQIFG